MFKCFVLWSKKSFLIVFILFYFDLEQTWWLEGKFYWMVKMIGFYQFILSCIRGCLVWSSVLLWWFGPEVVSFPEYFDARMSLWGRHSWRTLAVSRVTGMYSKHRQKNTHTSPAQCGRVLALLCFLVLNGAVEGAPRHGERGKSTAEETSCA